MSRSRCAHKSRQRRTSRLSLSHRAAARVGSRDQRCCGDYLTLSRTEVPTVLYSTLFTCNDMSWIVCTSLFHLTHPPTHFRVSVGCQNVLLVCSLIPLTSCQCNYASCDRGL